MSRKSPLLVPGGFYLFGAGGSDSFNLAQARRFGIDYPKRILAETFDYFFRVHRPYSVDKPRTQIFFYSINSGRQPRLKLPHLYLRPVLRMAGPYSLNKHRLSALDSRHYAGYSNALFLFSSRSRLHYGDAITGVVVEINDSFNHSLYTCFAVIHIKI